MVMEQAIGTMLFLLTVLSLAFFVLGGFAFGVAQLMRRHTHRGAKSARRFPPRATPDAI